jgi:hypothetical protein
MGSMLNTTASALKSMLCFIDAEKTPKIAYDNDEMILPLIEKIKNALGDRDGSQNVYINFNNDEDEKELLRQFNGVCRNIKSVFSSIEHCTKQE